MIRTVKEQDVLQIKEIYNFYILNSIVNFEENPITTEELSKKIKNITSTSIWIVYEKNKKILGYAYADIWKPRSGYLHTAETSVYIKQSESNKGIGTILYTELISRLKKLNFHVLIGGISLPNDASIALHEKFGFEKVAHFKEVGFKFNRWIDVGYWQLTIPNTPIKKISTY
jgi:phosphinothricin acetyltransferase